MKSIIQEASSIAKAVEEGWLKAQKPQQFSVKVLEEGEKNFLGLTKKSAKVAIFFDEPQLTKPSTEKNAQRLVMQKPVRQHTQPQQQPRQMRPVQMPQANYQEKPRPVAAQRPAPAYNGDQAQPQQQTVKKQFEPLWNQAMVDRTQEWMDEALKNSQNEHIKFTIEPQKFHLRITLSTSILPDPDKEKQLLASFSALILETLKRTFKMSLRGHKIVLTHQPR